MNTRAAPRERARVDGTLMHTRTMRALTIATLMLLSATLTSCETVEQIAEFIDSISDGAPCASDAECLGGTCLGPDQGFPNGYCTSLDCEEAGCVGLYSECFRSDLGGPSGTACFETCGLDGACDRAREGYRCLDYADTPVCLPPQAVNAPAIGEIGSSCSATSQCNGGDDAVCLQTFFGGYCAQLGCASSADCPENSPCVALNPTGADDEAKQFACMAGCQTGDDCRFGYSCQSYEGAMICLEDDGSDVTRNPNGVHDGQPCNSNLNCKGNTCIREAENAAGELSYPGGYCTTRDCDTDADCNGGLCISRERSTSCRAACTQTSDCRAGYVCREDETSEQLFCDTSATPPATPTNEPAQSGVEIVCGSSKSLQFDVPAGAIGFYIAPFTRSTTSKVSLRTLQGPSGTINLVNDYSFLNINSEILINASPVLFPASDAARYRDAFGPGSYTLEVASNASEICYYVIPQMGEGRRIALNLYFVGVPGVTAASAPSNRDVDEMVGLMKLIYGKIGVQVNVRQYLDASAEVTRGYQIIRDFNDVFNLVATSTKPSGGADEELSVNVFLIRDFNISDVPGLLGVSTGIPGMAGVHGASGSGLVFSAASLGQDNKTLGQTLAHEVGHFLGLRHTTEHFGSETDPISDTPECADPNLGFLCSDVTNFMFPFASGGDNQTVITSGQGFVIKRSPLTRP